MKVAYAPIISSASGKLGRVVGTKGRSGTNLRTRVKGRNPKTATQTSVRNNFTAASQGFKGLTPTQAANWNAAAAASMRTRTLDGSKYAQSGITLYNGLNSKLRQVTPGAALLTAPPSTSFNGDTITVTAVGATGNLMFTASAANAANTRTELMVQRLVSQNRKPAAKGYRSRGFIAFTGGALTSAVSTGAAYYSVAYRFVNTLTGQETQPVVLGTVQVS